MSVTLRHTLLSLCVLAFLIVRYYQTIPAEIPQPTSIHAGGQIVGLPYSKNTSQFLELKVTSSSASSIRVGEHIKLVTATYPQYQYGDILNVEGIFNERRTLIYPKIHKIDYRPNFFLNLLFKFRHRFEKSLQSYLPRDDAALAQGMVLGTNQEFSEEIEAAFKRTGTMHMIVVSGFNITLVAGSILRLAGLLHRRIVIILAIVGSSVFVLLTGAQPPAVRAGIMAVILLIGQFTGRPAHAVRVLTVTIIIMLAIHPQLVNSVSFQLSSLATIGLLCIAQPLSKKLKQPKSSVLRYLQGELVVTLSAQVMVAPVLMHTFASVSLISPPANLAVSWLIPYIMVSALILCLADMVIPMIAHVIAFELGSITAFFLQIISIFSEVPGGDINNIKINSAIIIGIYSILVYLIIKISDQKIYSKEGESEEEENE